MQFDSKILELPKIFEQLTVHAQTDNGKEAIKTLTPLTDKETIEEALLESYEALRYVMADRTVSFGGVRTITEALKRARIYGVLDKKQLLDILSVIEAVQRIKRELIRFPLEIEESFRLLSYEEKLVNLPELKEAIKHVFNAQGEIDDNASSTLKSLRSALFSIERKIKETLDQALRREAGKLTEALITMRYNRYVIPVKVHDKNNVKGTILDYSSSGETVYIEPEAVRELMAKKTKLESDEAREIERILTELSALVHDYHHDLKTNTDILTHLDVVFAKGKYAHKLDATKPALSNRVHLLKARHPLIPSHEVVANTMSFDPPIKMMVITGSNTGGKTVTLKTLGLLSLMVQCGLLIPVLDGSEIRVFNQIRADIGDEQSIEQSLSTFSSHMTRIISIVESFDDDALVLLDELGSGTDPKEGSALAMSILDELAEKDSLVVATTHYPELKAYAYTNDTVMNASVEFDEKTLKPTYRLLLRTPGESHAFLISRRLGLSDTIIKRAEASVFTAKSEVSELIKKLKEESLRLDKLLVEHEVVQKQLNADQVEAEKLKKRLQKEKENLRDKVMQESKQEVDRLKKEAESIIEALEDMKTASYKEHELADLKYKARQLNTHETISESRTKTHSYQSGDTVYVLKFNRYGELVKKRKDKQWVVKMGTLQSVFKEKEFELAEKTDAPKVPEKVAHKQTASRRVETTLDLRGLRVHEAEIELEKYLDTCALSKAPFASIIHGFGTLAVRKMVKEKVASHPLVKSHRDGEGNEGGQGVTVVYF